MLKENGIDFNAIKKELAQNGIIERDKRGKYTQIVRDSGIPKRMIKLIFKSDSEDFKSDFPF